MIYTVQDSDNKQQTYDGFTNVTIQNLKTPPEGTRFLVGVPWEDVVEWWYLQDYNEAADELMRYYRSTHGLDLRVEQMKLFEVK